jgi:hypothetical protein
MTNQSARIKEHAEVILVDRTSFFSTEDIRKGIDILADREHINILKQGIDTWNAWRKEYPEVRPDLSGAYNSGPGILSANLSDTYLISPNLSGANFTNADLNNTDLSGVNLSDAILSGANLRTNATYRRLYKMERTRRVSKRGE